MNYLEKLIASKNKNINKLEPITSEDIFNRSLCLPSGSSMNDNDLSRVVQIIKNLYER